jgi:glycosyltransferase involved in cell wall biosynthesis
MPPSRVVFLVENLSILRDRRVRQESAALAVAGYAVSVICPRIQGEPHPPAALGDVCIYSYPQPWQGTGLFSYFLEYGWSLAATCFLLLFIWLRHGLDVVHAANPPDLFFLLAAPLQMLGKKFVFDQHDLSPDLFTAKFGARGQILHRILLYVERCSYRFADVVIVTNESFRSLAISRGRCPADKLRVVRNNPDIGRFQCGAAHPELKQGAAFLAVYAGIMGSKTGVDRVVRAAYHIVRERGCSDVHFALLGDGDCRTALQSLARSLRVEQYISFPGFVGDKELLAWLSTADVCLAADPPIPLNQMCTAIKIMEYMSCGKPTVCFDLTEARYSAGTAALYVREDDPAQFGDAIVELLKDEPRRRRMGQAGLLRVRQELNWESSQRALLQGYEQLLGTPASKLPISRQNTAA